MCFKTYIKNKNRGLFAAKQLEEMGKKTKRGNGNGRWKPRDVSEFVSTIIAAIINSVTVPGIVVIYLLYLFQTNIAPAQKQEFFRLWFIEGGNKTSHLSFIINALLIALLVIQNYYFRAIRKIDKAEIKKLARAKSDQQELEIGKKLHNSKI